MKLVVRLLAGCVVLLAAFGAPASACVVPIFGLTFEQWLPHCYAEIVRFCGSNRVCQQQYARAAYQTYLASQQYRPFGGTCSPGAARCRNGWMDQCGGNGQWMATGAQCR